MSEKTYNIIITGELIGDISREDAIANFAATFKLPADKAEATLNQAPKVIKGGLEASKAEVYVSTLKKLGIEAKAEAVEPIESTEADVTETAEAANVAKTSSTAATQQVEAAATPDNTNLNSTNNQGSAVFEPKDPKGLNFKIEGKPDYAFLTVQVPADETLKVEASAMATMDTNMKMKTKMRGGLGRFLTGENIFINEFTAEQVPGEIGIAPGTPGDLTHRYLDGDTIFLQNSAYVASGPEVNVETKWQGLVKGFFSGESLFLIRCSGKGDLWFNTYGAIIEIDVKDAYVVDTGNIVAFTEGLEYDITKVGGYKSLFFSGEGFVCRFSGEGKVWIQTRSASAFTQWAHWFRPAGK